MKMRLAVMVAVAVGIMVIGADRAEACGGLFCQNDPVDQAGERIVFTVNGDDTITSLIEIQYQGSAPDFSWILPIPEPIGADDLMVPDDGPIVFSDLHAATDVQVIAPTERNCSSRDDFATAASDAVEESAAMEDDAVEVFASGEVGPFSFDVVGSSDPNALVDWLREHDYRVEPFMEPLIDVYVEEQFVFVAMQLLDGETADSIAPIEITYPSTEPMIPLRLTAVAANPNMPIWVWIFADEQAVPANYEHMTIDNRELTFTWGGQNDYATLVPARADALGGRAFITEFAGTASSIDLNNNYIRNRRDRYLTRLYTMISPDEMTVDPVFSLDPDADEVSNVRDASRLKGLYRCERSGDGWFTLSGSDAIEPYDDTGRAFARTPAPVAKRGLSWLIVLATLAVLAVALAWGRRASSPPKHDPGGGPDDGRPGGQAADPHQPPDPSPGPAGRGSGWPANEGLPDRPGTNPGANPGTGWPANEGLGN